MGDPVSKNMVGKQEGGTLIVCSGLMYICVCTACTPACPCLYSHTNMHVCHMPSPRPTPRTKLNKREPDVVCGAVGEISCTLKGEHMLGVQLASSVNMPSGPLTKG